MKSLILIIIFLISNSFSMESKLNMMNTTAITSSSVALKKLSYHKKGGISSNAEIIVDSTNSDYHAFPQIVQKQNGTMLMIWGNQGTHNPGEPIDVMSKMSVDGGKTWINETIIYGDKNGTGVGTPYFYSLGLTREDKYISMFGIPNTASTAMEPHISTSWDGINWETPKKLNITNHFSPGSTYVNFAKIKCLPDGTLIVVGYLGYVNDVCIVDIENLTLTRLQVVDTTAGANPTLYTEAVVLPLSQDHWIYIARTKQITYPHAWVTVDAGVTWVRMPNISVPDDAMAIGGWLPQVAETFTLKGKKHVLLGLGARKNTSAGYPNAPAVVFYRTPVDELLAGSAYWEKVAETRLTDNATDTVGDTDCYHDIIINDANDVFCVSMDELTSWDTSIIVGSSFSASETLDAGKKDIVRRVWLKMVGSTGIELARASARYRINDGLMHIAGTFIVSDTTLDTGAIKIVGFPRLFSLDEMQLSSAYGQKAGITELGLKTKGNTNMVELVERGGLSNLTTLEIDNGFRFFLSLTVLVKGTSKNPRYP